VVRHYHCQSQHLARQLHTRTAFAARNQVAVSACTSAVAAAAGFALDLDVAAYRC
jgi:hypothetical protein